MTGTAVALIALLVFPAAEPCRAAPEAGLGIVVELPAFTLLLCDARRPIAIFPVTIGDPDGYQTPIGQYLTARIEVDPVWTPPVMANWTTQRGPMQPGPANPMGRAKLPLGNEIAVHGSLSGARMQILGTHGCIRMSNADVLALGRAVLARHLPDLLLDYDAAADSAITESRNFPLPAPIPVVVAYTLLDWQADSVIVYPDIYRRGVPDAALSVMAGRGIDTAAVRRGLMATRGDRDSLPPRLALPLTPAPARLEGSP